MVTTFVDVRHISLKVRFIYVDETDSQQIGSANTTFFFPVSCLVVIVRSSLVGMVFEGISMLANALLLGSFCSVSAGSHRVFKQ